VEDDKTKPDAKTTAEDGNSYLFLSIFENPQEAMKAMRLFREYLSKKGRIAEGTSTQFGPDALFGVDPYQGKIVVAQKGPYLVGAIGFEQDKEGEHRLAELMKEIK
jgi:topoisomerase IA-like protein